MKKDKLKLFSELKKRLCGYLSEKELALVEAAFEVADEKHKDQFRKSKEHYITHPLKVAQILADLDMDAHSVSAALLHDVIEDCEVTKEDLAKQFGEDIAELVEGVTKLGTIAFKSSEEAQAENFRKMFLAMGRDIRVIVIKLADRLHNMQTLKYHSRQKQIEIAKETKEIFCPLAHRLGMGKLKWELEDLCFYYLDPENFQTIKQLVAEKREERIEYLENFCSELEKLIGKYQIPCNITGRPKHFFSIHNKLKNNNISFDELYDQLGVRVLVDTVQHCYEILGVVHSAFNPVSGRFKDYIAMPKSNLYQSLHTTVIGPEGKPVEIQIRTTQMHQIAEFGIAAHWRYKETGESKSNVDADLTWLREIIESNKDNLRPNEYLQNIKVDLFVDEVFVFSPKGDVLVLGKGATPIDFAYRVHSEVGNTTVGAKINGKIVPLSYKLNSGDQVEILTSKKASPKVDWLNIANSSHAKSKIKQFLKRETRNQQIEKGRDKIEKALLIEGLTVKKAFTKNNAALLIEEFGLSHLDEIFHQVSVGDIHAKEVVEAIAKIQKPVEEERKPVPDAFLKEEPRRPNKSAKAGTIRVLGEDSIETQLANCCKPVLGDKIIGFITMGSGVSIHKTTCPNVKHFSSVHKERLIDVEWITEATHATFPTKLLIDGFDRLGLFNEIIAVVAEAKINIVEVHFTTVTSQITIEIVVDVHDLKELNDLRSKLMQLQDVVSVSRVERSS